MVPPELRQAPHVSYTQLDTYLRCPLRYRLRYVDRVEPDFVPAALALGSGIHGAAAFLFRGIAGGTRPDVADVRAYFASLWTLETTHRPIRFGEKDTPDSLLDLGTRMLAVLCAEVPDATDVVAVESAFAVPLVDQASGAVLDRDLVRTLDLVERAPDGGLIVVDLKTAARKYTDLQVEASLQLSIYSYASAMNGLADEDDLRLRFDVLTKTKQPELHRYWTTRDRAANVRFYRLAAEVLAAVEVSVFPRASAGTARTARSGAGAGRGGDSRLGPVLRLLAALRLISLPSRAGAVSGLRHQTVDPCGRSPEEETGCDPFAALGDGALPAQRAGLLGGKRAQPRGPSRTFVRSGKRGGMDLPQASLSG